MEGYILQWMDKASMKMKMKMTNYIQITTPTIKVKRCNKGTNDHQKQNYCSAS